MSAPSFTASDLEDLTGCLAMRDADATWEWVKRFVVGPPQMFELLCAVTYLITDFAPLGLTKGVELGADDFWALSVAPSSSRVVELSGQILAASLNKDRDNVTALIHAGLALPEEEVGSLAAHVLGDYARVLHAMMRTDPTNGDQCG